MSPTSIPADLDELRDLDEAATPGPWQVDFAIGDGTHEISAAPDVLLCYSVGTDHDAMLIAKMRNALPALLSALTAARAERDEARAEEERYRQEARDDARVAGKAIRERDHLQAIVDASAKTHAAAQRIVELSLDDSLPSRVIALELELAEAREQAKQAQATAAMRLGQLENARQYAEQAQAVVAAAYKFADDMALFCSPHGVSYHYAEQLRSALKEAGGGDTPSMSARCGRCGSTYTPDSARYPHAPCQDTDTSHEEHVWGDPQHYCEGRTWKQIAHDRKRTEAQAAPTTCGHQYIGDEGEFACELYTPHDGRKHWNSLAEFGWPDDAAPVSAVPATDDTGHADGAA